MDKKNEFSRDGNLKTRLKFSGIVRPQEIISKVTKKFTTAGMKETEYWIMIDEYGARFMVFEEELAMNLRIEEPIEIFGKIGISKGGTYLVVEKTEEFIPETYKTQTISPGW